MRAIMYDAYISPISPLYLPYISRISPVPELARHHVRGLASGGVVLGVGPVAVLGEVDLSARGEQARALEQVGVELQPTQRALVERDQRCGIDAALGRLALQSGVLTHLA